MYLRGLFALDWTVLIAGTICLEQCQCELAAVGVMARKQILFSSVK